MILELKNVSFSYSQKKVLCNFSYLFEEGKIHALTGENGAGKSTLADIICGERKPECGQILLDGKEVVFSKPKDAIEAGISYVHQYPMLADEITVRENLIVGLEKKYLKTYVDELDVLKQQEIPLNAKTQELSSDQRFFAAFQRAMLKKPELIILDEPTALLDEKQRCFLYGYLRTLAEGGKNIIVITHYPKEAKDYCDDILKLQEGQIYA